MQNQIVIHQNEVSRWDSNKWDSIKQMFVPQKVSQEDAFVFIELAKTFELNPFKKEIWVLPYWDKKQQKYISSVFAGRDGFLSIAHRTGQFDGMETNFEYDEKGSLKSAETTCFNKSCSKPIKVKVLLSEYYSDRNPLWKSKTHTMLQKVAESQCLRRAFNINGLYAPEEIDKPTYEEPSTSLKRGNFEACEQKIRDSISTDELIHLKKMIPLRFWTPEEKTLLVDAINEKVSILMLQSFPDNGDEE